MFGSYPLNDIEHSKIKYITVSFDLDQNKEIFNGVTDVICCLELHKKRNQEKASDG